MRWGDRELGAEAVNALPGLARLDNLVRSVRTPEFAGITFHEVLARSALNRVPGGGKALPFGWTINPYRGCSHACTYCLDPSTLVLMGDGRQKPIGEVSVGDEVYGTERNGTYRRYARTRVEAKWTTRKPAFRVTLADGTEIVASGDHRFLTERGWKYVEGAMQGKGRRPSLTTDSTLMGFGLLGPHSSSAGTDDDDYRRGCLTGMIRGDGMIVEKVYAKRKGGGNSISWFRLALTDDDALDRTRTYLRGILRISDKQPEILRALCASLTAFQIPHVLEPRENGVASVRLVGGLPMGSRFLTIARPAISRKLSIEGLAVKSAAELRVVSIEDLGETIDMVDITTGSGDFIANGVVSHNCFARSSHRYLELDTGKDFDSEIIVKVNVAEVLGRELARPGWERHPVALGTNTDPYQRAEGRYALMPGIVSALADSGTPFSILTKGTLLRRDLPLIVDAAGRVPVDLAMSIAVYDDELQQSVEPGTPTTKARLATVTAVREAGLDCTVFLMPILPYLTDTRAHLDEALRRAKDAGATAALYSALHLRAGVKEWFMAWLAREHPELVPRYREMYARSAYAPSEYRRWLAARIRPLIRRHGLESARGSSAMTPDPVTGGVRSRASPSFRPSRRDGLGAGAADPGALGPGGGDPGGVDRGAGDPGMSGGLEPTLF